MYRVISRLIILPILSVRNLLIAIWAYRVSLLHFIEIGERFVFLLSLIHGKSNFYIVPDDKLRDGINAGLRYSDRFHSDEIEDRPCPEHYELLVVEKAHYELLVVEKTYSSGGTSRSYGVAIDSSASEVIYWTNGW